MGRRLLIGGGFVLALVVSAGAEALEFTFEDLHIKGTVRSMAHGGDARPVGFMTDTTIGNDERAVLWSGPGSAYISLHPSAGYDWTQARDAAGSRQFGLGKGDATGGLEHALEWSGTADSVKDVHPTGYAVSWILKAGGSQQVGIASYDAGAFLTGAQSNNRAMLWDDNRGVISLHVPGAVFSEAAGTDGRQQVGMVRWGVPHAALWSGSADSFVDLNPGGDAFSEAFAVWDGLQGGYVDHLSGMWEHAALWRGSADSIQDINPEGFTTSRVADISAAGVVGYGWTTDWLDLHGLYWDRSGQTVVDLSAVLGGQYKDAWAVGIGSNGDIYGFALSLADHRYHALVWHPVPEPVALVWLAAPMVLMMRRRS